MALAISAWVPVTIRAGNSLSDRLGNNNVDGLGNKVTNPHNDGIIDITGMRVIALRKDALVKGTAITFQVSFDGGTTFENLYQTQPDETAATNEYQVLVTTLTAQAIIFPTTYAIYAFNRLKVRTGLAAGATNQDVDVTIWLGLEDVEAVNS